MQEIYITQFERILKTLTEYLGTKTETFMFDIFPFFLRELFFETSPCFNVTRHVCSRFGPNRCIGVYVRTRV